MTEEMIPIAPTHCCSMMGKWDVLCVFISEDNPNFDYSSFKFKCTGCEKL